jgi:hypothetical protein
LAKLAFGIKAREYFFLGEKNIFRFFEIILRLFFFRFTVNNRADIDFRTQSSKI